MKCFESEQIIEIAVEIRGFNQLNRVCFFHFFGVFIVSKGSNDSELFRSYSSSLQLLLCRVAAVKSLPIHHHSVDYIFWSFGITEFIFELFRK